MDHPFIPHSLLTYSIKSSHPYQCALSIQALRCLQRMPSTSLRSWKFMLASRSNQAIHTLPLLSLPYNTSYQYTLSIHSINTPVLYTISTIVRNKPHHYILSTHPINTSSPYRSNWATNILQKSNAWKRKRRRN